MMTHEEDLRFAVNELTARLQAFHNGDFVTLLTQGDDWAARSCFTGMVGRGPTPESALKSFESVLIARQAWRDAS